MLGSGIRIGFITLIVSVSLLWAGVSEADRRKSSSHHGKAWSDYRRYSDKDKYVRYANKDKPRRHSDDDDDDDDGRFSKKHKHKRHSNNRKLQECRADLKSRSASLKKAKTRMKRRTWKLNSCNADLDRTQEDLASCQKDLEMCDTAGASDTAPVPQTGQTQCWDSLGNEIIDCMNPPTGQDGDFQAGVLLPDPRFKDNLDGTFTDNLTGLVWLQNANCASDLRTWDDAFKDVTDLNSMGMMNGNDCFPLNLPPGSLQTDWRLPNVNELLSLVDYGSFEPALSDSSVFTNFDPKGAAYWSSTSTVKIPGSAWFVNFDVGSISQANKRFPSLLVLPVRDDK